MGTVTSLRARSITPIKKCDDDTGEVEQIPMCQNSGDHTTIFVKDTISRRRNGPATGIGRVARRSIGAQCAQAAIVPCKWYGIFSATIRVFVKSHPVCSPGWGVYHCITASIALNLPSIVAVRLIESPFCQPSRYPRRNRRLTTCRRSFPDGHLSSKQFHHRLRT